MSERARAFWELLNNAEDLVHGGTRTVRPTPKQVRFREQGGRPASHEVQDVSTVPTAVSSPSGRADASDGPASRLSGPDDRSAREHRLTLLEERVKACERCHLHSGRMNAVPGAGVLDPLVLVVGEAPGAEEDRRGVPFVGRAGQFLDKWLDAIGLSREKNAYIANIVKCRPPQNRDPLPHESESCLPYLREQISLIRPTAILSVGRIASAILIGTEAGIGRLRGRTYYYEGIPLVPTYHPSGVLRNPELKRPVWEDLKRLRELLPADG